MRAIRFLFLCLGLAVAAAGCAREPMAYVAYQSPGAAYQSPGVAYRSPPIGIDNVVYGATSPGAYAAPVQTAPYAAPAYGSPAMVGTYAPAQAAPYGMASYARTPATYAAPMTGAAPVQPAPYSNGLYGYAGPGIAPAPMTAGGYTMDSGDRLRIVVFGQDGLTNSYVVGAGGTIDMPLIGSVMARGLTTDQLAARVSDKLRNGFIREPHVAVEIEAYRPFFILGEVTQPGQYPYVANMTVETAVAIAGGFTPRAARRDVLLTRNFNGRQVRMAVPTTFPLRPGDTVSVQERWF